VPDRRLELAYDAAKSKLSQQDGTLGSIRNRATSMFTAAALAVSFTAAIGLISGDGKLERDYPVWASIALLVVLTGMGTAVMVIQWPAKGFHFGPSASVIVEKQQAGEDEDAIRLYVIKAMTAGGMSNAKVIRTKQHALRWVVGLLWLEIILIVAAVVTTS
jgi:hypothetical protein